MSNQILTGIGECMIEMSAAKDGLFRKSFAGDVFNTLHYARKALGADWTTSFYTGLGVDALSDELRAFLKTSEIETDQILTIPDRTPGLYMIHLDGAERSFSYWRDHSAARLLASDQERLKAVIDRSHAIYLSGITLAILPSDHAEFLIGQLNNAKAQGKMVAFDPNIRPRLWADPNQMRQTISDAASSATIVLPSFDDEMAAFGDQNPADTINRYGAEDKLIVVKNGSSSVLISDGDGQQELPTAPITNAVDTTGAGDSFNGAFLASYLASGDAPKAVNAGQTCAGRVICHHGAII